MGIGKLSLKEKPTDMPTKQAAAAVGQCELMYAYDKLFSEYNHTVAQILVTGLDLEDPTRYHNIKNTMNRLLELNVLPIINENDTVNTDEISVGDNDTLGAIIAVSMHADMLVLLSDIDGLYTADPHKDTSAKLIDTITEITPEIEALGGKSRSGLGTGGMATKLSAAKKCIARGTDVVIANGSSPSVLYDIVDGKNVGTRFIAKKG
jgi:glutamate 5-kinase